MKGITLTRLYRRELGRETLKLCKKHFVFGCKQGEPRIAKGKVTQCAVFYGYVVASVIYCITAISLVRNFMSKDVQ